MNRFESSATTTSQANSTSNSFSISCRRRKRTRNLTSSNYTGTSICGNIISTSSTARFLFSIIVNVMLMSSCTTRCTTHSLLFVSRYCHRQHRHHRRIGAGSSFFSSSGGNSSTGTGTDSGISIRFGAQNLLNQQHIPHVGRNQGCFDAFKTIHFSPARVSLLPSLSAIVGATTATTASASASFYSSSQSKSKYSRFRKSVILNLKNNDIIDAHDEREDGNSNRVATEENKNNVDDNNGTNVDPVPVDSNHTENNTIDIDIEAARQTILLLAQKNKTWKRLSSIVDLASSTSTSITRTKKHETIADIGCDHGLLSIALAVSGRYKKVLGIDVSSRALEDGALTFHRKVLDILGHHHHEGSVSTNAASSAIPDRKDDNDDESNVVTQRKEKGAGGQNDVIFGSTLLPLEFRLGDGLTPLRPGEADAVCIAGMGVESMLSILKLNGKEGHDNNDGRGDKYYLNNLNCQTLYLQPPKNRPKHLMILYKALQENNEWLLIDERIVRVKNRWYVTCAFERQVEADKYSIHNNGTSLSSGDGACTFRLPGHFLSTNSNDQEEFRGYMQHHLDWLNDDLAVKGYLSEEEKLWRDKFKEMK